MNQNKLFKRIKPRLTLTLNFCILALLSTASASYGQDAKPPEAPKKWDSVASVDLMLTRGNSRNFLGTATVTSTRKWAHDEVLLGGSAGYGDTTTQSPGGPTTTTKTQDYLKGYTQWNHLFSDRFYGGLRLEGLHDDISDIDYRFTVSPLAGYYLIKATNTFLSVEVGPSYVDQKLGGHTDSYLAARVAERFEHKFSNGAKVWQTLEWLTQVDKIDNWIVNAEAGVSAPINKVLDVRLVAQDTYNNQPAAGRLKNDLKFLAGIGYRF